VTGVSLILPIGFCAFCFFLVQLGLLALRPPLAHQEENEQPAPPPEKLKKTNLNAPI